MQWITRCPHCKQAFVIGDNEAFNPTGKIRCGFCYSVYELNGNLYRKKDTVASLAEAAKDATQSVPAAPAPSFAPGGGIRVKTSDDLNGAALTPEQEAIEKMKALARQMQRFETMKEPTLVPKAPEAPQAPVQKPVDQTPPPPTKVQEEKKTDVISMASGTTSRASQPVQEEVIGIPEKNAAPEPAPAPILPTKSSGAKDRPRTLLWGAAALVLLAAVIIQGAGLLQDKIEAAWPGAKPFYERVCAIAYCRGSALAPSPFEVSGVTIENKGEGLYAVFFTIDNTSDAPLKAPELLFVIKSDKGDVLSRNTVRPDSYMPKGSSDIGAKNAIKASVAFQAGATAPASVVIDVRP